MHKGRGIANGFCSSYFILMFIINHFYDIYASKIKFKVCLHVIKSGFFLCCANIHNQERFISSRIISSSSHLQQWTICTRKISTIPYIIHTNNFILFSRSINNCCLSGSLKRHLIFYDVACKKINITKQGKNARGTSVHTGNNVKRGKKRVHF